VARGDTLSSKLSPVLTQLEIALLLIISEKKTSSDISAEK
jgi:hypothetical protein